MPDRPVSDTTLRWAGAAGIGFAVLLVAGNIISGAPDYDKSDQYWVSWFQDSGHRAAQIVGMFLVAASALLLILFFVTLLRRAVAAGGNAGAAAIAGVSGTVLATVVAVSGVIRSGVSGAVAFAPNSFPVPSADVLRTLDNLAFGVLAVAGGFAAALFIASFAHAVRDTAIIPNWLSIAGYVVGVVLLLSFLFFPFLLLPLWMFVAGITVAVGRGTGERGAEST